MLKKILSFVAIIVMTFFGACSNEENLPETKPEVARTISLTVAIEDDNPNTRVSLSEKMNGGVALKWEANDELKLAFVQGATTKNGTAKATNITNGGKRADFTINVPDGIVLENVFNLYGVHGEGGLSGTIVTLPTNAGSATSLSDVQTRKDAMLYFKFENFDANNPPASVTFQPLGSFFKITLKNTNATESLNNLQEARLVGVNNDGNTKWAYNSGAGGKTFNLATGKFENTDTGSNYLSFTATNSSLSSGETMTFWGWYPPITYEEAWNKKNIWPELQLQLRDANTTHTTSFNSKRARTTQTAAGRSYYFYAAWNGTQLEFTDESFSSELGPNEYFVPELVYLSSMLNAYQIANIETMIVKGYLNGTDYTTLSSMPKLTYLDLKDVTCEDNTIPQNAFGSHGFLHKIATIILPGSVTTIGKAAFKGCSHLVDLTLPPNLITIEDEAFQNCSAMSGTLIFPTTITSIGANGFNGCTTVTAFRFPHTTLFPYSTKMLHKDAWNVGNATVQVPSTLLESYKAATGWSAHAANIVPIP